MSDDFKVTKRDAPDGYSFWTLDGENGSFHNSTGPAVTHVDGYKAWFRLGRLHRLDGPAVEHPDGRREFWIDGVKVGPNDVTWYQFREAVRLWKVKQVLES